MHSRQAPFPGKKLDTSLKDYHKKIVKNQSSTINLDCSAIFPLSFHKPCLSAEECSEKPRDRVKMPEWQK